MKNTKPRLSPKGQPGKYLVEKKTYEPVPGKFNPNYIAKAKKSSKKIA